MPTIKSKNTPTSLSLHVQMLPIVLVFLLLFLIVNKMSTAQFLNLIIQLTNCSWVCFILFVLTCFMYSIYPSVNTCYTLTR